MRFKKAFWTICLVSAVSFGLNMNYLNSANDNSYTPNYQQYLNNAVNQNQSGSISQKINQYHSSINTNTGQAQNEANNLYQNSINGNLTTKGGIGQNINTPMNGGSQLHTFNGVNQSSKDLKYVNSVRHQNSVHLYCPSSAKAVEITIGLSNGGYTALVQQSTQLNGNFDNNLDIELSGVCANGIIQCNPLASWGSSNCTFYEWQADSSGRIRLTRSSLPTGSVSNPYSSSGSSSSPSAVYQENPSYKLQGCVCTNASCGVNDVSAAQNIASLIAGGIEQAISKADPSMLISKGEFDVNTMTYTMMGQNASQCNFSNYSQYSTLPFNPSRSEADQMINEQESDPNAPYQIVEKSYSITWNKQQVNVPHQIACNITNSVVVNNVGGVDTFSLNHQNTCGHPNCGVDQETICDASGNCVETYAHHVKTGQVPLPSCTTVTGSQGIYKVCTNGTQITVANAAGNIVDTFNGTPNNMWFNISRTYDCGTQGVGMNMQTFDTAISSAQLSGNTMNYDYYNPTSGSTSGESATLQLENNPNTCPSKVCMVQYNQFTANRFGDGTNRGQYNESGQKVTKILVCQNDNGNYVCPANGGTIVQGCQCQDSVSNNYGFDMAITTMSVADKFANQFYCGQ